ncbi:extracellular solute-binding protein [Mesorhizobium sp.]|uniref:extracellular solute-binding protein n=1 Tax=Mesorhizobium sp. TaxID=1871066 RepID=UPI0025C722E0|nr:extracellular solute-binding protein [Mesorhizobium sp.]
MKNPSNKTASHEINRRRFLHLTAAAVAAPAIIGKAPAASAKQAFAGEELSVMVWSGNYEDAFRTAIVSPFNEKFGTKATTLGGWDQIVSTIKAAPADDPPFDVTVMEEMAAASGVSENLFAKTDLSKIKNLSAVQPWYFSTRAKEYDGYGVPFGLGFELPLMNTDQTGHLPLSWKTLWDPSLVGKLALDGSSFFYLLAATALAHGAKPGLGELYDWRPGMTPDPLFQKIEELRPAKWYHDGAELSFVMMQDQAAFAQIYSSDAFGLLRDGGPSFKAGIPDDGTVAYGEWYVKVRGTKHDELSDVFLDYILEKETQDRFLAITMSVVSRRDVTIPPHWKGYPVTNDDLARRINLIPIEGWKELQSRYGDFDARFKEALLKTSKG